ncbi:MAG: energy transducer TonB [Blastocatellales bacterium]
MKNIGRRFLSSVCALTLAANGVAGVMAQDKKQEKSIQSQEQRRNIEQRSVIQSEGQTFTIQTGAGQTATFGVRVPNQAGGLRGPDGFDAVWVAGAQTGGDGVFQFFSQEMSFDNRLIKGAPFSAQTVSETIQTLPDGNRIVQQSEGYIYRDSQGRTRNEKTFQLGGSSEQRQTINIFDPVAGVNYMLEPETRTARKMNSRFRVAVAGAATLAPTTPVNGEALKKISVSGGVLQGSAIKKVQPAYPPVAKAAKASGPVQIQVLVSETGEVIEANVISGHPLLRDAAVQAARQWQFKPTELGNKAVKVNGVLTFNFTLADEAPAPAVAATRRITKFSTNTEQLGKQMVEGVECEGTREVMTIPAGAIGNERPIETVREKWSSPELNMVIMTKQSDPRFGESSYRVTNISRSEPDASLFQVPSDYTVKEGGYGFTRPAASAEIKLRQEIEMREALKMQEKVRKPDNQ